MPDGGDGRWAVRGDGSGMNGRGGGAPAMVVAAATELRRNPSSSQRGSGGGGGEGAGVGEDVAAVFFLRLQNAVRQGVRAESPDRARARSM
jgi:hypothetical protein